MTFFYLLCFILLVAGVAFLLELTPEGITDDLMTSGKYVLRTFCASGTVLGHEDSVMNKK